MYNKTIVVDTVSVVMTVPFIFGQAIFGNLPVFTSSYQKYCNLQ